jgi:hypothetical protein
LIYKKFKVHPSKLSGKGLFADEDIPIGAVVANLAQSCPVMTEDEYQKAQLRGDQIITMTAVRWIEDRFLYGDSIGPEEYINHSFEPNMLYHCGICFARTHIQADEELTVDYRYFLAENDVNKFRDALTGQLVDGFPWRVALQNSSEELMRLSMLQPQPKRLQPQPKRWALGLQGTTSFGNRSPEFA